MATFLGFNARHGDALPCLQDPAVVEELQPGDKIAAEGSVNKDNEGDRPEDVVITDESGRVEAEDAGCILPSIPGERVPKAWLLSTRMPGTIDLFDTLW